MKLVLRVAATSAALQLLGQQVPSLLGTYCGLRMVACEAGLQIFILLGARSQRQRKIEVGQVVGGSIGCLRHPRVETLRVSAQPLGVALQDPGPELPVRVQQLHGPAAARQRRGLHGGQRGAARGVAGGGGGGGGALLRVEGGESAESVQVEPRTLLQHNIAL